MTENMIHILEAEKRLSKMPKEKLQQATENIKKMREAEEKTAGLSIEEIIKISKEEGFNDLPLTERQFMAAKTWGIWYGEYRMLMDDIYEDPDTVELGPLEA